MENETQEQSNNRPWLYKKGQSGNPGGRPKGSKSLKTWLKERFETMTDEEREDFFNGMNKIDLFKMAEGNPKNESDVSIKELPVIHIAEDIAKKNDITSKSENNSQE